jgi:hypothetical protein
MKVLAAECPETNRIIPAGTVAASGEILEAPLLVTVDKDMILIDGVQVVPRPLVSSNFQAEKIAGRLHSQFFLDDREKNADASARVEERLNELKTERTIDDFKVWKRHGKLAAIRVAAGGGQARAYMDGLPAPLLRKYQFIIASYAREYQLKKEAVGREPAQAWLKARLDEMASAGKIAELRWEPEKESAGIKFPGDSVSRDFPFGEDMSPFGQAYSKHWKARHKTTEAAVQEIVDRLKAGDLLIYSGSFEKASPSGEAALRALRSLRDGKDSDSSLAAARESLDLSDGQAASLSKELK